MARDAEGVLALLESGDLPPVLAIGGVERNAVDDVIALTRKVVLAGGLADFNHDRASAKDRKLTEILSMARTLPVMAQRRLVEVRDCDALRADDLPLLEAYLADSTSTTLLLLLFGAIDLREKLPKLLDAKAVLGRFEHPKERDMQHIAARRARRHGLSLGDEEAEALGITVGTDLGMLERALEKLVLVADDGIVTVDLISTHVADTRLEDAFGLARAVAAGDRKAALTCVARLQAARESDPIQLVGMLAWQLRQLLRARAKLDDGMRPDDIGRELNAYRDRLTTLLQGARRLDGRGHVRRLERLAAVDRTLKSSRAAPWVVLVALIQDLCPVPLAGR